MTIEVSTILPSARIELPGIPSPVLDDALYRILREFFWESEAWKYTYDNGKDWTANTLAIPSPLAGTDIPAKTTIVRVDAVKYDSDGVDWATSVPFKTRDELDRINAGWRTETGSSPQYWTHDNDGAAVIYPQTETTVDTAFLVRAVIAPIYTALDDDLPDKLYYANEKFLRAGILADLMKQPGKDWTDSKMAAFYARMYESGITRAKSKAEASGGQPSGAMAYGGI